MSAIDPAPNDERVVIQMPTPVELETTLNRSVRMVQAIDGVLNQVRHRLVRMLELAIDAAGPSTGDERRESLDESFAQLGREIDDITRGAQSGLCPDTVLDCDDKKPLSIVIARHGGESNDAPAIIALPDRQALAVTLPAGMELTSVASARRAVAAVDQTISLLRDRREQVGVVRERLFALLERVLRDWGDAVEAARQQLERMVRDELAAAASTVPVTDPGAGHIARV